MSKDGRDKAVFIRATVEEKARAETVARHFGASVSDWFRMRVTEEFERIQSRGAE